MAKGTEHRDAVQAIERVLTLKHFRPETAHRAIGATLSYLGARRVLNACDGPDQDLIERLALVEDAAIRLDVIPQRVEHADERGSAWIDICDGLTYVQGYLNAERRTIRGQNAPTEERATA